MIRENSNQHVDSDDLKSNLIEEVATVSTRDTVTGRVRITTTVDRFEEMAQASLQSETVEVIRVAIGRPIDVVPEVRVDGDVTIIPIVEEILIVEKRLMLKEELHIRKTIAAETISEPVSLRRQRAVIERFDEAGSPIEPTGSA